MTLTQRRTGNGTTLLATGADDPTASRSPHREFARVTRVARLV
ncbi:hypothetical protein [Pseudofrankia sp. BMG5.37]|nr:hypothetical protein [Pseudofrankia sp. BMG5.37]MDT3444582.1 hypothetical protein [Pseudofrankia sp. BMG5.37]